LNEGIQILRYFFLRCGKIRKNTALCIISNDIYFSHIHPHQCARFRDYRVEFYLADDFAGGGKDKVQRGGGNKYGFWTNI
jgi:hypothetical protein